MTILSAFKVAKVLSAPVIGMSGYLFSMDNNEMNALPAMMYTTNNFYNADSNPDAKLVLVNLESEKYSLRKPILISLKQEDNDEYIACFEEAELSRSGETPKEAINWLESSITTLFELLKSKAPGQLGPLPARQLRVLGDYLVAKSNPKA